jgi:hypothetical protein
MRLKVLLSTTKKSRIGPVDSLTTEPVIERVDVQDKVSGVTAEIVSTGGDQSGRPPRKIAEKKTEQPEGTTRFCHEKAAYESPPSQRSSYTWYQACPLLQNQYVSTSVTRDEFFTTT